MNIITLKSLLNTFKELNHIKLTSFNLKIVKIEDITNEKIIELKDEFPNFLK